MGFSNALFGGRYLSRNIETLNQAIQADSLACSNFPSFTLHIVGVWLASTPVQSSQPLALCPAASFQASVGSGIVCRFVERIPTSTDRLDVLRSVPESHPGGDRNPSPRSTTKLRAHHMRTDCIAAYSSAPISTYKARTPCRNSDLVLYKSTGLMQYNFPKAGDEYPDFVSHGAEPVSLAPEELLQIKRRGTADLPPQNASKSKDGRRGDGTLQEIDEMGATGYFDPSAFLGPDGYIDTCSPADDEAHAESNTNQEQGKSDSVVSSVAATPIMGAPASVASVELDGVGRKGLDAGSDESRPTADQPERAVHMLDGQPMYAELPDRSAVFTGQGTWIPIGSMAELPTSDTLKCADELAPIEMDASSSGPSVVRPSMSSDTPIELPTEPTSIDMKKPPRPPQPPQPTSAHMTSMVDYPLVSASFSYPAPRGVGSAPAQFIITSTSAKPVVAKPQPDNYQSWNSAANRPGGEVVTSKRSSLALAGVSILQPQNSELMADRHSRHSISGPPQSAGAIQRHPTVLTPPSGPKISMGQGHGPSVEEPPHSQVPTALRPAQGLQNGSVSLDYRPQHGHPSIPGSNARHDSISSGSILHSPGDPGAGTTLSHVPTVLKPAHYRHNFTATSQQDNYGRQSLQTHQYGRVGSQVPMQSYRAQSIPMHHRYYTGDLPPTHPQPHGDLPLKLLPSAPNQLPGNTNSPNHPISHRVNTMPNQLPSQTNHLPPRNGPGLLIFQEFAPTQPSGTQFPTGSQQLYTEDSAVMTAQQTRPAQIQLQGYDHTAQGSAKPTFPNDGANGNSKIKTELTRPYYDLGGTLPEIRQDQSPNDTVMGEPLPSVAPLSLPKPSGVGKNTQRVSSQSSPPEEKPSSRHGRTTSEQISDAIMVVSEVVPTVAEAGSASGSSAMTKPALHVEATDSNKDEYSKEHQGDSSITVQAHAETSPSGPDGHNSNPTIETSPPSCASNGQQFQVDVSLSAQSDAISHVGATETPPERSDVVSSASILPGPSKPAPDITANQSTQSSPSLPENSNSKLNGSPEEACADPQSSALTDSASHSVSVVRPSGQSPISYSSTQVSPAISIKSSFRRKPVGGNKPPKQTPSPTMSDKPNKTESQAGQHAVMSIQSPTGQGPAPKPDGSQFQHQVPSLQLQQQPPPISQSHVSSPAQSVASLQQTPSSTFSQVYEPPSAASTSAPETPLQQQMTSPGPQFPPASAPTSSPAHQASPSAGSIATNGHPQYQPLQQMASQAAPVSMIENHISQTAVPSANVPLKPSQPTPSHAPKPTQGQWTAQQSQHSAQLQINLNSVVQNATPPWQSPVQPQIVNSSQTTSQPLHHQQQQQQQLHVQGAGHPVSNQHAQTPQIFSPQSHNGQASHMPPAHQVPQVQPQSVLTPDSTPGYPWQHQHHQHHQQVQQQAQQQPLAQQVYSPPTHTQSGFPQNSSHQQLAQQPLYSQQPSHMQSSNGQSPQGAVHPPVQSGQSKPQVQSQGQNPALTGAETAAAFASAGKELKGWAKKIWKNQALKQTAAGVVGAVAAESMGGNAFAGAMLANRIYENSHAQQTPQQNGRPPKPVHSYTAPPQAQGLPGPKPPAQGFNQTVPGMQPVGVQTPGRPYVVQNPAMAGMASQPGQPGPRPPQPVVARPPPPNGPPPGQPQWQQVFTAPHGAHSGASHQSHADANQQAYNQNAAFPTQDSGSTDGSAMMFDQTSFQNTTVLDTSASGSYFAPQTTDNVNVVNVNVDNTVNAQYNTQPAPVYIDSVAPGANTTYMDPTNGTYVDATNTTYVDTTNTSYVDTSNTAYTDTTNINVDSTTVVDVHVDMNTNVGVDQSYMSGDTVSMYTVDETATMETTEWSAVDYSGGDWGGGWE
ncbi:uncharacterized protein JN550_011627 [Neoarthrinium moseri]|uniref:uncharacterized protein n=1 Tax=Neoarthrinium moseri TaxID=1658444 RepID=UPI001FDE9D08|nr:uncharacterized protein JN550_011627 [Neoarthrinium moseri]KAI1860249.1 hypothetical protein JN550_011627 [Neoarthrinium moseri]